MKTIFKLTTIFAFAIVFLISSNNSKLVMSQEDERSQAEIELAEELEIEMRQLQDLQARLEAERAKSKDQAAAKKAKQAAQKAKQLAEKKAAAKREGKNKKSNKSPSGINARGTIEINGKKIDVGSFLKDHEKEIESWAEKHASEWEKWAEKFESKMEKFAEQTEGDWEDWADGYSKRWEKWAEGIESGSIDREEISKLVKQNLEMLSEMPLEKLVEGALKEGLGELKNAPWESLGELHELVGGSLEKALSEMEKEVGKAAREFGNGTNKANGMRIEFDKETKSFRAAEDNLAATLKVLQEAIETKSRYLDADSNEKLSRLRMLLGREKSMGQETIAKALELLHQNRQKQLEEDKLTEEKLEKLAEQKKQQAAVAKDQANAAWRRLNEKKKAYLESLSIEERAKREAAEALKSKSLEKYMNLVKNEAEKLKAKESQIEKMRREITELRREVERMRKSKKGSDKEK